MQSHNSLDMGFWDEYNSEKAEASIVDNKNEVKFSSSYTHLFLKDHKLSKYFNDDCKRIIQFGAASGEFLKEKKQAGWSTIGYDISSVAVKELKSGGIEAKQIDLNSRDDSGALSYADQLKKDISIPANILLIRVLQYLELPALNLLLFDLIDNTAPGSVFFIAGNIKASSEITAKTPYYKSSFFGPRIDMEILENCHVYHDDELLVIRKR